MTEFKKLTYEVLQVGEEFVSGEQVVMPEDIEAPQAPRRSGLGVPTPIGCESAMAGVRVVLAYRDYAALPNDGRRYEIHDGELSVTPAPSPWHQDVVLNFATVLRAHVSARGLGRVFVSPIDVILSDTSIVQPDVVYVATDRLALITGRGIEGAPTLVVEALSPSTRVNDRHAKMQLYARHGIPWYWLADPETRTAEAYALEGSVYTLIARAAGDESLCAPPFPDLTIASNILWA